MLSRVLTLCLGLVLAVVVSEIAVRVFAPSARDHALPRALVVEDPVLGWRLAKNEMVVHHSSHFETRYTTNSRGLRDRLRSERQPEGEYRVLIYGDSQVFGWGIEKGERFSDLAEAGLSKTEVWNLGVPGYGLDQQILAYVRDSETFEADLIVLYLSEASLHRLSLSYIFGLYKPHFTLDPQRGLQLQKPKSNFGRTILYHTPRWLYLPYFIDRQLAILDDRLQRSRVIDSSRDSKGLLIERLIDRALDVTYERRENLALILYLPARERKQVQGLCAARSLECFVLELPQDRSDLIYGKDDPHWNATAHALIAGEFTPFLDALVVP